MTHIHPTRPRALRLILALLLLAATPAAAQDFYVITNDDNILAHPTATTIGNVAGNNFNITTCLWTIDGNKIIAIAPDGTTGNYLRFESGGYFGLSLSSDNSFNTWNNASDGGSPQETNGNSRYIRYNSGWTLGTNATGRAALHQVTVTTNTTTGSTPTSESYTATIDGNTAIYTTGAHNFSRTISHSATYTTTTTKTFSVSINGTNRSGNTTVNGTTTTTETYTGALTNVAWSVSDDTYGNINASTGELTITSLPTSVDNITVTYTAQVAGQTVTATKQVTLMSAATYADAVDGGTTGVTTSTVTLNDYEPHEWAYYNKELGSPIRSWNPANVKISYYGYGAKYTSQSDGDPTGDLTTITSSNALVRVGPLNGETQHTFVYYKTLERTDGTTAANPSGRCEYRTIPNPFSVRPRINHSNSGGTGNSATNYTGFYMWRLKTCTGGSVYTTANGGTALTAGTAMVDAEQVLYFAPSGEYGMTVEFEAIWAPAYVTGTTHASTHNAYERNFYIGARTSALNYAATISAIYPDGTNGSNTTLLTAVPNTTQSSDYTCGADTKFEYNQMGANITLTANNHYLCVGRGCGTTNNVMTRVRGMGAGTNAALNYTMRIESGKMNYMAFVKGTYDDDYGSVGWGGGRNNDAFSNSGTNHVRVIIGCDYDRATDANTNLYIYNDAAMGSYCAFSTPNNNRTLHATIKSGSIGAPLSDLGDGGSRFVYLGVSRSYTNTGLRQLYIEGGEIGHMAGGIDGGSSTDTAIYVRMTGGHILGCMYGSGAFAAAAGIRKYVITGGNIQGWVAGGCNGVGESEGGTMNGETFLYIGGNGKVGYNASGTSAPTSVNNVVGGTVFAAGRGNSTSGSGRVNNSTLVLADNTMILNNAYGGGNLGFTQGTANVWLFGDCTVGGKVFGGSNIKGGSTNANVTMRGGNVIGGVYGGINGEGYTGAEDFHMTGNVNVNIEGGTVGAAGINPETSETGHVFGSGFGDMTHVDGNVVVTIGDATGSHKDSPLIHGNVYGGGHAAPYTSTGKTFQVIGQNGLVKGSIFGGGKGSTAVVTGPTDVHLKGHIVVESNVFGGGHAATVTGDTHVTMED